MAISHLEATPRPEWVLLSNHGYVLLTIAEDPTIRLRDIARAVGITERATIRIVRQLVTEGFLRRRRVGRRNVYTVDSTTPMRHPAWSDREVRLLLAIAGDTWTDQDQTAPTSAAAVCA